MMITLNGEVIPAAQSTRASIVLPLQPAAAAAKGLPFNTGVCDPTARDGESEVLGLAVELAPGEPRLSAGRA